MKFHESGDKSKAICESCKALVPTTFQYRDVAFDDGSGCVKNILVAVCDHCGTVVSIPAQSTPAIKRARDTAEIPLEVFLSAREIELLDVAAWRVDPDSTSRFRKPLLAYYIRRLASDPDGPKRLRESFRAMKASAAERKLRAGPTPRKRLSCKVSPATNGMIEGLMNASGLNKSDLVKGVVHEIERVLVVPDDPKDLQELRDVAAVVNA
jgi:hypothetical protein